MPVDSSIYNQMQTPDFFGAVQKGLSVRDMLDQKSKQKKLSEAYQSGIITNPDGTTTVDSGKTMSALAGGGFGKEAMEYDSKNQEAQANKLQLQKAKQDFIIDTISRAWPSVKTNQDYQNLIGQLKQNGVDLPGVPESLETGGKELGDKYYGMSISVLDQKKLDNDEKNRAADTAYKNATLAATKGNNAAELRLKEKELEAKKLTGENLPIDKKDFVKTLATKNANKVAIKNQIDSVMGKWDSLDDDQKVAVGRALLKTLNSAEGADAIGVEEAKRLGGKLEFAMGNFTNSNTTQFGRDLDGFKDQANNISQGIDGAVQSNQSQIDQIMGRAPQEQASQPPAGGLKVVDQNTRMLNGEKYLRVDGGWQKASTVGKR